MTKTGKPTASKTARPGRTVRRVHGSNRTVVAGFAMTGDMGAGFLARTRLKKAGGSLVMTVPASARNLLNLTEGQEMVVSVDEGRVVAEPVKADRPRRHVRRPKYTIEELVAGMNPDAPLTDEERAWMDEPPVGRETW